MRHTVTLIPGDGIGVEISEAVQRVFAAANAPVDWEMCQAGKKVFDTGDTSGVPRETRDSIAKNKVVLKGPLETPVGSGAKSANVTIRKFFELFGNVRPAFEFPGVKTPFSGRGINFVTVRENVEDLYAGIEHMQTPNVSQCIKLISRKGCEKIIRLAFELAIAENRKSVHCAHKANIMKLTEGEFKRVFEEIAPEYPNIQAKNIIIDNLAHQLVRRPEDYEIIVCTNMNGDIISDLAAGLVGGLGVTPSGNIGDEAAMFEAVHGSAPDIAGQWKANPTAFLMSAVMMLRHLGDFQTASKIEQAVMLTLKEGKKLTGDLTGGGPNTVSTLEFADEIIANLERAEPDSRVFRPLRIHKRSELTCTKTQVKEEFVGVDIFVQTHIPPLQLADIINARTGNAAFKLEFVSVRGILFYPDPGIQPDTVDHYRCRFIYKGEPANIDSKIFEMLSAVFVDIKWMHLEKIYTFDGVPGFSKPQGM